MKLVKGSLERLDLREFYLPPYPRFYVDALIRIIETSVETIKELAFKTDAGSITPLLRRIEKFPALESLTVWEDDCLTERCFRSVQPGVKYLQLSIEDAEEFLTPDGEDILAVARRFPKLEQLHLKFDMKSLREPIFDLVEKLGPYIIAHWPTLKTLTLEAPVYDLLEDITQEEEEILVADWGRHGPNLRKVYFNCERPREWDIMSPVEGMPGGLKELDGEELGNDVTMCTFDEDCPGHRES
ncbi:hypothetical protein NM688_g8811 [Phlebia brevispora]|uniref:Uncharacterized protein n=1 Tax=Phlebia brevispora TaxID=194682 RepID=A0ACC1RQ80_9APHY|nr:hypothetical protein NM688_g8811 [Phlebia brevispora]